MSKKMSPVFDHTEGKLKEAIAYARKIGDSSLITNIQWKRKRYGCENQEVHIYPDYAPLSFEFAIKEIGTQRTILYGGIIFHGKHDGFGSGAGPTFSVCLTPTSGWSTHT